MCVCVCAYDDYHIFKVYIIIYKKEVYTVHIHYNILIIFQYCESIRGVL